MADCCQQLPGSPRPCLLLFETSTHASPPHPACVPQATLSHEGRGRRIGRPLFALAHRHPALKKKCAAASSRGAGASLVTQKEKMLPASFEEHGGHGANAAGSYRADVLHHVARLAGARSGAVASSAVSQSLTQTITWPWFPDEHLRPCERGVHVDCRRTQSRSAGYFGTSGPFCPRDTIDTLCASQ